MSETLSDDFNAISIADENRGKVIMLNVKKKTVSKQWSSNFSFHLLSHSFHSENDPSAANAIKMGVPLRVLSSDAKL